MMGVMIRSAFSRRKEGGGRREERTRRREDGGAGREDERSSCYLPQSCTLEVAELLPLLLRVEGPGVYTAVAVPAEDSVLAVALLQSPYRAQEESQKQFRWRQSSSSEPREERPKLQLSRSGQCLPARVGSRE